MQSGKAQILPKTSTYPIVTTIKYNAGIDRASHDDEIEGASMRPELLFIPSFPSCHNQLLIFEM